MKKLLLGALVALLPLTAFSATVLGFQFGGGSWDQTPSGTIVSTIGTDTLNETKKSESYTYFMLEHPVPLIPNIRYANTKATATSSVFTLVDLKQTDTTLYYEILDNVVSFDLGLTARKIDGLLTTSTSSTTFSGTVPMLYISAEVLFPSDFSLVAEINTISSGTDKITDISAKLTYTTPIGLGVEVGTRTQTFDVDIDNVQTDIKFSGIFAGVYFKF